MVIFSVVFIYVGYNVCKYDADVENMQFEEAIVTEVTSLEDDELSGFREITFKAKILSGEYKDKIFEVTQSIDPTFKDITKSVEENDSVVILKNEKTEFSEEAWVFAEYNRINILGILIIFFLLIIILIGKSKGITTIISLVFTILAIFLIYIPGILNGFDIYLLTIVISVFIIFMSITVINGFNKKSLCAILGNLGGLLIAGLLGLFLNQILNLTGILDEDYIYLTFIENSAKIELTAVIWGSIVIGSLGAIMDVAMSLASSINELSLNMENKSTYKLIKSGMEIGKDAIGTMTNTLILAYVGSSLVTILLITSNNNDMLYIFNREMIVVEIMQGILGSIGILFAVPFTVIISAKMFTK